jgi:acylaminoacyl-peptidase
VILVRKLFDTLEVSVIKVPGRHPTEIIVTRPKSDDGEVLPCVTCPHGGPHSSFGVEFNPFMLTIALQGCTPCIPIFLHFSVADTGVTTDVVSQVNYTGSTGFGEKFVQELRGRCGTLDVQDCMASIEYLIRLGIAERNPRKQFLVGGSHGGFLAIHRKDIDLLIR